jgi:hypothetical protein
VWLLAGAHVQVRWLTAQGYTHPELHRCLVQRGGHGDQLAINALLTDGWTLDRTRALQDALRIVDTPAVWTAIQALADLLVAHGAATPKQVATILSDHEVGPVFAWTP